MPAFQPPVAYDLPSVLPETRGIQYRAWRRYGGNPVGVSVVKVAGVYTTIRTPTTDQLVAAGGRDGIDYFLGGHTYVVSDAVSTALIAAGYGSQIGTEADWGGHGATTWGTIADRFQIWEAL